MTSGSHDEVSNRLDGKVGEPRWRGGEPGTVIELAQVDRGDWNYDGFCADDQILIGTKTIKCIQT